MSTPINNPGSLLFAAAASYAKGHETSVSNSKEKAEKENALRMILFSAQKAKEQQKANDPEKGFLA
jgi:hypothetical protein